MKQRCRRTAAWIGLALAGACASQALAADLGWTPLFQLRWRHELSDTLSANSATSNEYTDGHFRARFGGDVKWGWATLHGLGQAAFAYNLPPNGSFGPGKNYFTNSGSNDTAPYELGLAEFSVLLHPIDPVMLNLGRQGLKDVQEKPTGDHRFDWLKSARLSERLIGTYEWTNNARRFDGFSGSYDAQNWNVSGFGAGVLQGGFDYQNSFEELNSVKTAGLSFTSKRGSWVPGTEVRFFDIMYRDDRAVTIASLGDRLLINAAGASLLGVYPCGPGAFDALLWGAYESGDYGSKTQAAQALIFESGYGWPQAPWSPWLRAGVAYASGNDDPTSSHHGTFFNMAPTNHKFYGIQDLNAFQNLIDILTQLRTQPTPSTSLSLEGHIFRLSNTHDVWYNGSGPSSNTVFGFTANAAPAGTTLSPDLGSEVDLVGSYSPQKWLVLELGLSHFEGGDAIKTLFPTHSSSNFLYFQTSIQY